MYCKIETNENPGMRKKILIAEDEEVNYFYIYEVLEGSGYEIIHAWDGKQAIELYKKEKPDLILMDIKMPIINGYEALKEIKLIDEDVPIIAITAYALSGDKDMALNAGFDAYLSKPVSAMKVLETITKFMD